MNQNLNRIFSRLWNGYSTYNPSVAKIHNLFESEGEKVVNDHIAFRTLDIIDIDIEVISKPFLANGYVQKGEYTFKEKHLYARHYELPGDAEAPRVFISQLKLDEVSSYIKSLFIREINMLPKCGFLSPDLIYSGAIFSPLSYEVYKRLREESEYAAWFYVFGFRANHFTVSVNHLAKHNDIFKVNELLKSNGFKLNSSGGEVKGTPEELLQQSSTMADIVNVQFVEGEFEVPSCYYEFAQRFPDADGKLYSGFIAKSADKIFESTNFYTKN
ncbi:MAG: DUF1338 domain-containing protein [Bacteroidales bacterium]